MRRALVMAAAIAVSLMVSPVTRAVAPVHAAITDCTAGYNLCWWDGTNFTGHRYYDDRPVRCGGSDTPDRSVYWQNGFTKVTLYSTTNCTGPARALKPGERDGNITFQSYSVE